MLFEFDSLSEQKAKLKLYFNHAMFYNPSSFNEEHVRKEFERNAKSFGITDSKIISNLPIPQDLKVAKKYLENRYVTEVELFFINIVN